MTDDEKDAEIVPMSPAKILDLIAENARLAALVQELERRNIELRAELTKLRRPRAPDVA